MPESHIDSRLKKIRLTPVSFESLGVRSMCTMVETVDLKILVDPGVSLGPRWGLFPHPEEYVALREARDRVRDLAEKVDIVTISHYHYDHYSPAWKEIEPVWTLSNREVSQEIFSGKRVLAKDIRSNINFSQRKRGWLFQDTIKDWVKSSEVADGRIFEEGSTRLSFSHPVPHGEEGSSLGYVLMLGIECDDERIMHCSDVQGPASPRALGMILDFKPDVAIIGGPPFYLSGFRVSEVVIESALRNAEKAAGVVPLIIYDHHPLRSEDCFQRLSGLKESAGMHNHEIVSAAEFSGVPNKLLEAKRRELYKENPPSGSFCEWTRLSKDKQRRRMPPV